MSGASGGRPPKVSDEDLKNALRKIERPVATTKEIADQLPIGNDAVRHRLDSMVSSGEIEGERLAQVKVWWSNQ